MTTVLFNIRGGKATNGMSLRKAFMSLPDGLYELTIKKRNKRSLQQNRYYFGVCVKMIRENLIERGNDVSLEDVHDWLRFKFNYIEIVNYETGEVERLPKSTADLNKEEFGQYIEKIQHYAATSMDLVIPNAGEQMMISYE